MGDITNPRLLYLKAVLFLVLGLIAVTGILILSTDLRIAVLLLAAIWAFCRAYYFVFYVVEHYIDPQYRFAGLSSFVRYLIRRR